MQGISILLSNCGGVEVPAVSVSLGVSSQPEVPEASTSGESGALAAFFVLGPWFLGISLISEGVRCHHGSWRACLRWEFSVGLHLAGFRFMGQ